MAFQLVYNNMEYPNLSRSSRGRRGADAQRVSPERFRSGPPNRFSGAMAAHREVETGSLVS